MKSRKSSSRKSYSYKAGRDAFTGQFIPLAHARRRKATATVETMVRRSNKAC